MKKLITTSIVLFLTAHGILSAQTNTFPTTGSAGIGTLTPASSSALDIQSTTQGMLVPRMTKAQRDVIASPVTGLLIYQTNSQPGFYFYNGAAWTPVSSKGANTSLSNLAATTSINTALTPNANNTLDLGSASLNWNEIYVNAIKFMDGSTQSTAGGGATYTPGTGISIVGSVISNTGDTNAGDDVTTATNHAGDITGLYNNLQIASGAVGSTEIADGTVSSTDILNGTIAAADLSAMGAISGQVMQYNGASWVATTPAAGAETDPQVGSNTSSFIPRWDGSALVTGAIADDGDNISVGWNILGINPDVTASFYNTEGIVLTEDIALRGVDQSVAIDGTASVHAFGNIGYNTADLFFTDAPVDHVGVWGAADASTNSAAVYAYNTSVGPTDYALVAKSAGSGTTNIGIYAKASGATNNYALIVPDNGGKSGFNWATPNSIVGIKQNGTDDALRVVGTDLVTDFVVSELGKVGINTDPNILSSDLSVNGTAYFGDRVGIGVSTALTSTPLTVSGTDETVTIEGTNPYLQMVNATDNIGYLRANGDDLLLATNSENDLGHLIFRTNGTDRMYIDESGNFVIGGSGVAPKAGYKLSIDGKVVCEELLVQLSPWPDYVFHDDYQLMSLDALSEFIATHNHLPNIPTAAEVENEGLNVGEMQKLMMEKIEELTLYMLDLKEQNEALQQQIETLKQSSNH